jgi:hypothetical protein
LLADTWRVCDGPEWTESVEAANPGDEFFGRNLETIDIWLRRDPYWKTTGLTSEDDSLRVLKTRDRAAGYRLTVVVDCNDEDKPSSGAG